MYYFKKKRKKKESTKGPDDIPIAYVEIKRKSHHKQTTQCVRGKSFLRWDEQNLYGLWIKLWKLHV